MRIRGWGLGWVVIVALACGDDDSGSNGGNAGGGGPGAGTSGGVVGTAEAKSSCDAQCDAQDAVANCDPFVPLQQCKALCDQIVKGTPAECLDEFRAYYDCTVSDGFRCAAGFPAPNSGACDAKQDAFDACANGPGGTKCEGQNANGVCPQVACPCPEGTKMVSGVDTTGAGCKCLDAVSCKDLFCD